MATLLRFKTVHIDSNIRFSGIINRKLKYTVRSLALEPAGKPKDPAGTVKPIPEIFWQ